MAFTYCGPNFACPCCGSHDSDCRVNGDGVVFCHTHRDDFNTPFGFRFIGTSRELWGMMIEEGQDRGPRGQHAPRSTGETFRAPPPPIKREDSPFVNLMGYSETLRGDPREFLAESLGLPLESVDAYRIVPADGRTSRTEAVFTIVEHGYLTHGAWGVVAITTRAPDGTKRTYGDPDAPVKRGLTLLDDWDVNPSGPVVIVEGATDTITVHAMGVSAIGRPSNSGGGSILSRLLRDFPGREIIVLGENDLKPDGKWPGRTGAESLARELARSLGVVRIAFPPAGAKDAREWFRANWKPGTNPARLDESFLAAIRSQVQVIRREHAEASPAPTPEPSPERVAAIDQAAAQLRDMGDLFASLPATPPSAPSPVYEAALAERQAQDRRNHRCFHCNHQRVLCQEHRASHIPRTVWVRCEKWTCDGCRRYLIARELRNAQYRFGSADALYEIGCATRKQYDAITKRLRRAFANYIACRDGNGWWVVCSRRILGSIPTTPEAAVACFEARVNEWLGDKRPVKTSHGWRLPRAEEDTGSHTNVGVLPVGTTFEEVAEVASRFNAYAKRQMREAHSRVQQSAEWLRGEQPWSETDSANFFTLCISELGGYSEAQAAPAEEADYIPW